MTLPLLGILIPLLEEIGFHFFFFPKQPYLMESSILGMLMVQLAELLK